jgi:hypothetical protein
MELSGHMALPPDVDRSSRVSDLVGTDRIKRSILTAALRTMLREPPQNLLDSIDTLGDASDWFEVRRQHPPGDVPRRAADATQGKTVRLRPVREGDISALYDAAIDPRWGFKWRYRGSVPSPAEFHVGLYQGTLTQFVIENVETTSLVGWVGAYNARQDAGTAYIAVARASAPNTAFHAEMIEGMYLLINYLFATWPFRKLYAEIAGFNWSQFAWGEGVFFEVEGVLTEHDFHDGVYWDQRIIAFRRDEWGRVCRDQLDSLFGPVSQAIGGMSDVADVLGVSVTLDPQRVERDVHGVGDSDELRSESS